MKAKKEKEPLQDAMVRTSLKTKLKVARFVVGRPFTIGEFYAMAAEEKLKKEKSC